MGKKIPPVGAKEGLGLAIILLGLLMLFIPAVSQQIAELEFVSGSAYAVLIGAVYVLSVFIILSGVAVIMAKFRDNEDEE